jgi:hypothetical protein
LTDLRICFKAFQYFVAVFVIQHGAIPSFNI